MCHLFSMMKILILTLSFTLSQSIEIRPTVSSVFKRHNEQIITHEGDLVPGETLLKHKFSHFFKDYSADNNFDENIASKNFVKKFPESYGTSNTAGFTTIQTDNGNGKNTVITEANVIKPSKITSEKLDRIITTEKIRNLLENDVRDKLFDIKDRMKVCTKNGNTLDFHVNASDTGKNLAKKIIEETKSNAMINNIRYGPNPLLLNERLILKEKLIKGIPVLKTGYEEFKENVLAEKLNEEVIRSNLNALKNGEELNISQLKTVLPQKMLKKIKNMNVCATIKEDMPVIKSNFASYATNLKTLSQSKDKQIELYKRLQELRDFEKAKMEFGDKKIKAKQLLSRYDVPIRKGVEDADMCIKMKFPRTKKKIIKRFKPIQNYVSKNKDINYNELLQRLKDVKNSAFDSSSKYRYYYDEISKNKNFESLKKEYERFNNNLIEKFPEIKNNSRQLLIKGTKTISEADKIKLITEFEEHLKLMKNLRIKFDDSDLMEKILSSKKFTDAYTLFNKKRDNFISSDFDIYSAIPAIKDKIPNYVESFQPSSLYKSYGLDNLNKLQQLQKIKEAEFNFEKDLLKNGIFSDKITGKYDELIANKRLNNFFPNIPTIETVDFIPENLKPKFVMKAPAVFNYKPPATDLFPEMIQDKYLRTISDFPDDIITDDGLSKKLQNKELNCNKDNLFKEDNLFGTKNSFHKKHLPFINLQDVKPLSLEKHMPIETTFHKLQNDKLFDHHLISKYPNNEIFNEDKFKYDNVMMAHSNFNGKLNKMNLKKILNKSSKYHEQALEFANVDGKHLSDKLKFYKNKLQLTNALDELKLKAVYATNKLSTQKLFNPSEFDILKGNFYKFKDGLKDAYDYNSSKQKLLEIKDNVKNSYNYGSAKRKLGELKEKINDAPYSLSSKKNMHEIKDKLKLTYNYGSIKHRLYKMESAVKNSNDYNSAKQKLNNLKERLKDTYAYDSKKQKLLNLKDNAKYAYVLSSSANKKLNKLKANIKDASEYKSSKLNLDKLKGSIGEAHDYASSKLNLDKLKENVTETLENGSEKAKEYLSRQGSLHSEGNAENAEINRVISSANNENAAENNEKTNAGGKRYKQYVITTRRKKKRNGSERKAEMPKNLEDSSKEKESSKK